MFHQLPYYCLIVLSYTPVQLEEGPVCQMPKLSWKLTHLSNQSQPLPSSLSLSFCLAIYCRYELSSLNIIILLPSLPPPPQEKVNNK